MGNANLTITNMSPECKAMIVKKLYEHYTMSIKWREAAQKFSTMCIFIFPLLTFIGDNSKSFEITVLTLSVLVSSAVTFFCDAKDYYLQLHKIEEIYKMDCKNIQFDTCFENILPLIREIDFARGRSDYNDYCNEHGIDIHESDKLTSGDIRETNRQRIIVAGICSVVCLLCGLIIFNFRNIDNFSKTILIFIGSATIIGFILMMIEYTGAKMKRTKKVNKGGL